jgi:AraC family transcriptional regulator
VLVVERLLTRHHGLVAPVEPARVDWRLARAIDYLEARIAEDIGLRELADVAAVSPSRLSALFRSSTGEPPHRWLMRRRFERACEMLADPRASVTEVAHACGFASSQHLATVFRKRLGTTPSDYRRERLS